MIRDPARWDPNYHARQIIPQFVGYNIGDCDLVMGPALVGEHWFCFALEPNTMKFYVLDSMRGTVQSKKTTTKKKQAVTYDPQEMAIAGCRERFHDIIGMVRPDLTEKMPNLEIVRPDVPQQSNLRDCGVHVLIWLSRWKPNLPLEYTQGDVAAFRRDLMWWLVNHDNNECREDALNLIPHPQKGRTSKRRRKSL
ncbi:uncharacterized protein LOC114760818 [Neltuma alba]|uniref:uncharacterized protein LOC114760818 n=1 Tax=Neltuma alba TaxID=207710 RepID=UPI0010A4D2C8|nr:uncharacterized protein LOC114760818 [Prosopis alba]